MQKNKKKLILVVDDDKHILEVIEARLSSAGYKVLKASNGREALNLLEKNIPNLIISDLRMPGMDGMELLKNVEGQFPDIPFIILTAFGTIPDAVSAIRLGAVDYLTKPFDGKELLFKVGQFLKEEKNIENIRGHFSSIQEVLWGGKAEKTRELYELIEKVAPRDVSVLLIGESGTGKERITHIIHDLSPRKNKPLVIVDCGSTPAGLLESELFGHVKGSFTHALRDKKGLIEEARDGTLFLDEIGNISNEMQTRLLRFLENRRIRRIGDTKEISIDCRVIAATNADLPKAVAEGTFREDLYYRLRVVTINIPPLRERVEDILPLAQRFMENYCSMDNLPTPKLSKAAQEAILAYAWPGNVRELKNTIEAGVVLSNGEMLLPEHLQIPQQSPKQTSEEIKEENSALSLEDNERQAIIRALEKTGWVQKHAADILGISRRALHYKIGKYEIELPNRRNRQGSIAPADQDSEQVSDSNQKKIN